MSEHNIFLVPVDEPFRHCREVSEKVLAFLRERRIVGGCYDEELGWHAAGEHSAQLFSEGTADNPAFEYLIVYDREAAHFIPDNHTGRFGASCSACNAFLDEVIYEFLNEQGEGEDALDVRDTAIKCPICQHPNQLIRLRSEIPTAVTTFYLNFCDVDSFEIADDVQVQIERILGSKLRVIPERL